MYYYTLDGVEYPLINLYSIPVGYGEVDVEIGSPTRDRAPGVLLAGHIAYTASAKEMGARRLDTVSPSPQWFVYQT